jgi:hypothetical protein
MVGQMNGIVVSLYQSMPILTTGDSSHRRQPGKQDCGPMTALIIKVFYLPTDAQYSCFKRILEFKLKQLLHVSVQPHHRTNHNDVF